MDRLTAARIIESLRTGTVPIEHVNSFTVGREMEFSQATEGIGAAENGQARIAFINGAYGSGKTHFLGMIRNEALRRKFAVTHVVLSSASCPLDKLQMVFGSLMTKLHTPECRERPAFRSVLDMYISMVERDLIATGMANQPCRHPSCGSYLTCGHGCFTELLMRRLTTEGPLTTDFHIVLNAYFNANRTNNHECMTLCERWLWGQELRAQERKLICRSAPPHVRLNGSSGSSME